MTFGRTLGFQGVSMIPLREMVSGAFGIPTWIYDYTESVMTPNVDQRRTTAPFWNGVAVQGKADGSGIPDVVSYLRGNQISRDWYDCFDPYQGSIVFRWIPEFDRDATFDYSHLFTPSSTYYIRYEHSNSRFRFLAGNQSVLATGINIVAGTPYFIVVRWDGKNPIDGTNYLSISINDAHTYGATTQPTVGEPGSDTYFGSGFNGASDPANGIIEGLTVYRRVLTDGDYGHDVGNANGDEIAAMYAAGVGADPCLITKASWDVDFCLPTDCTTTALATGIGSAWSHPYRLNELSHGWCEDGGYLGDEWGWNTTVGGTNYKVDIPNVVALDDLIDGANGFTWDGWIRKDDHDGTGYMLMKDAGATHFYINIADNGRIEVYGNFATTDAYSRVSQFDLFDKKWHHIVVAIKTVANGGDSIFYIAVDGKWATSYDTQTAGVGAWTSDAAFGWQFARSGTASHIGAYGWQRFSNINTRYTVGTDFIPSRTLPAADGNTVEQWPFNDGTGNTITATVVSPGHDGTSTGGAWEPQWDQFGSPVIPYTVYFDGSSSGRKIDCGSGATVDDLADNAFTPEGWFRIDSGGVGSNPRLLDKSANNTVGWLLQAKSLGTGLVAIVYCATTNAYSDINTSFNLFDGKQHHIAMFFDDAGDRKIYLAVDGIWASSYGTQTAGVGAIVSDAATNLTLGNRLDGSLSLDGAIAFARVSDSDRYNHGTDFIPPCRLTPPAPDGNTMAQYNFRDGAGTTLTDSSGNANHGTISNGVWQDTIDMETDTPGDRVYPWGYVVGCDAVDEGIVQNFTGLSAGENYVFRPAIRYERDHRAQPYIQIWDATNGAQITKFDLPWLTGTHDGGNNSATLSDSTAPKWPVSLIGAEVYNITDGSHGTITIIAGDPTIITAALAGGTDNDWDNGDEYRIFPTDIWLFADPFAFELPTIARYGVAADCTAINIRIANDNSEGVFYFLQAEDLENLVGNPSFETGAGNPWIPDGWTNAGLDPGEGIQELNIVHSGTACLQIDTTATISEGIRTTNNILPDDAFISIGTWIYGNADNGTGPGALVGYLTPFHTQGAGEGTIDNSGGDVWNHLGGMWRNTTGGAKSVRLYHNELPAANDNYWDDVYAFVVDDVSLTVTPASQANSVETIGAITGLRNDGRDSSPAPISIIQATTGSIWFKFCLRHDDADITLFGNTIPYLAQAWGNANNYISTYFNAANSITLAFNDGGGVHTGVYATGGALAENIWYQAEWRWIPSQMQMFIDGVAIITIVQPVAFAVALTLFYPGSTQVGANQIGAVFG